MTSAAGRARDGQTSDSAERDRAAAFFDASYQAFERAAASKMIERCYRIAGYGVRLSFAGPVLPPLITRALEHLAAPPGSPADLTVCLWDSVSTGTRMSPPPWQADDYIARGEVRGYNDDRFQTAFHIGADALSILDNARDLGLFWVRAAREFPYYESGAPLRTILHWWMRRRGCHLLHAAALATRSGGVLLVGKGGSGKSTTALACLRSELLYASDDYCLLADEPVPYVHSVYNSAKLDPDGMRRFPHLAAASSNAERLDSEKALVFLHEVLPGKIVSGFPIRAVLLPRVTGRSESTWQSAPAAAAFRALAPSTVFQLSGAGDSALHAMTRVVKQAPCYYFDLGTDVEKIPDVILRLLAKD